MANIIFTSLGSGGDVIPFLRIGSRLTARGHRVALISHYHYADAAKSAGIQFSPVDGPEEYSQFVRDEPLLNSPHGIPEFLRRHVFPKTVSAYDLIRQQCLPGRTLLVTRDLFDTAVRISAEKLDIPFIAIFVSPSQPATWQMRIELFRQVFAAEINRLRDQLGLPAVSDWRAWLRYSDPSIAMWPDWFAAPDAAWPPGVMRAGFIIGNKEELGEIPDDLQTFLDGGAPPILIAGSTGLYLGSDFYKVSAEGCRLLGRRAVLVTQHREHVPEDLPESIRWFSYAPFHKLMGHVAAVVHHGGIGTLGEATAAGAPQLVLPMGADRPDNAIRLKRLGVADYLLPHAWKPRMVAEKLSALTQSDVVAQNCRILSARMSSTDAIDSACGIIEQALA